MLLVLLATKVQIAARNWNSLMTWILKQVQDDGKIPPPPLAGQGTRMTESRDIFLPEYNPAKGGAGMTGKNPIFCILETLKDFLNSLYCFFESENFYHFKCSW